jgi:hypothetical protein
MIYIFYMKMPGRCPVCENSLKITSLRCTRCGTEIRGEFSICEFCNLSPEELQFLRIFLAVRGNLSEVAKKLGISHPTARAKLDSLLYSLGYEVEITTEFKVSEILDKLEKGEITADEAIKLLKEK